MVISMAIHGVIIAFFSLLAVNLPEKIAKIPPIQIKKIIFENKKAAPARGTNSKRSVNEHKPTKAAQSFRRKKIAPSAQAKPLTRTPEALNMFVPVNRSPEKPNRLKKLDIQPMTPISFIYQITQPITFEATYSKPKPMQAKNIKSKSFSSSLSVSSMEPVRMVATSKSFSSNPFGKPMQVENIKSKSFSNSLSVSPMGPVRMVATGKIFSSNPFEKPMQISAIPKGFVNDLPNKNSLAKHSKNMISGTEHGVTDSIGDDLKALKKGYSSKVWSRIANAKFYPRRARKREIEGKPVVEFELRSDGQLMNYLIVRSSSNKILDKAAIDAVKNARPYPDIPKLLKLNSIRFKVPISFMLNKP